MMVAALSNFSRASSMRLAMPEESLARFGGRERQTRAPSTERPRKSRAPARSSAAPPGRPSTPAQTKANTATDESQTPRARGQPQRRDGREDALAQEHQQEPARVEGERQKAVTFPHLHRRASSVLVAARRKK